MGQADEMGGVEMTKPEALKIGVLVMEAYPNLRVTERTQATWATFVADLEYQPTMAALTDWIRTSKFPPTIAELRERALQTARPKVVWRHG
jgi:hypothetical protein